jgi:hypothetical protein
LPDSPGRAARKPAGKKLQFSGTEALSISGRFMAGEAQRNKFQGLRLFWGPAKQDFSKPGVRKMFIAAEFAYKLIVVDLD